MKGNREIKESLKVIISEFQRQKNKVLSDIESVKILKKLKKWAEEELSHSGKTESVYLKVIESYIPFQVSESHIKKWIEENIDLSQFKNKMQAMKPIMAHFGVTVNGNVVKEILNKL